MVDEAETLYIYPEQYEGQECHPLIFCTGPVPAQQVEPFFPWLMRETGAKTFYLPSADYIWPRTLNKKVREVVTAEGGSIVGEEYFPLDHMDYERVVDDIMASGADVVFNTIVPPGSHRSSTQLHDAGLHEARRAHRLHVLRRELPEPRAGASTSRASTGASTTTGRSTIRSASSCSTGTTGCFPGSAMFTGGQCVLRDRTGRSSSGRRPSTKSARSTRTT